MIDRVSPAVSWSTAGRELRVIRLDYRKHNLRVTPLLSNALKHRRLTWCHQHEHFNWNNLIFSYECSIWTYPLKLNSWAKNSQVPLYQRWKHSQKFHVWGGVSLRGTTPLCVFLGNMNSEMYKSIQEGHFLMSEEVLYPDGFIFQQDNVPNTLLRRKKNMVSSTKPHRAGVPKLQFGLKPGRKCVGTHEAKHQQKLGEKH